MFCKSVKSNRYWITLLIVGIVSLVFGAVGYKSGLSTSGNEMVYPGHGNPFDADEISNIL